MDLLARSEELGLSIEAFWRRVGLARGAVVADVGAGAGRFAFPAAERVGPSGRVYAVEISAELVAWLREEAGRRSVAHLAAVRSTPQRIPLEDGIADIVLLANVLHDVSDRTVQEAVRLLGEGGSFVNLDWKKGGSAAGPPAEIRLAPEQAARRLAEHGLRTVDSWEPGPYHYAARFVRRGAAPRAAP
jgi:ubiquinone/menaquinone biosynthesis C-methylase UbiE